MLRKHKFDILIALALLALLLIIFFPVTFGGKSLVPFDNIYAYEPWRTYAAEMGIPIVNGQPVPHNELLSDLVLENFVWKKFIVESIKARRVPLWNPYLFAGVPFLAAGQHSALYPLSVLFYIMPIWRAYGFFTVLQLFLAGIFMYVYMRTIRVARFGAAVAALVYALSGFMLVSVVFSMIIAAVCWLPLLLAIMEKMFQIQTPPSPQRGEGDTPLSLLGSTPTGRLRAGAGGEGEGAWLQTSRFVPWVTVGAVVVGIQFLAGHVEISIYNLTVMAFYGLARLIVLWNAKARISKRGDKANFVTPAIIRVFFWLWAMVIAGIGLAAIQIIPMYELVSMNFRQGSASYTEVVGWAYPTRQIITFLIPDFFGNPAHHHYFNPFTMQLEPFTQNAHGDTVTNSFWGIKNYVEAGSYVGILPLFLAAFAIIFTIADWVKKRHITPHPNPARSLFGGVLPKGEREQSPLSLLGRGAGGEGNSYIITFTTLAVISLLFIFGTPLYAVLFFGVPGFNQLHSAFRWVFPYTLSMAILAGIGAARIAEIGKSANRQIGKWRRELIRYSGWTVLLGGGAVIAIIITSLITPAPFINLAQRFVDSSDLAQNAFANGFIFYCYQLRNLFIFALMLVASGIILRVSLCPIYVPILSSRELEARGKMKIWKPLALLVIALDFLIIYHDFNPATAPRLYEFTPSSVKFLQNDDELYRVITYGEDSTFNPNVGMFYNIHDAAGYDSMIPMQYADYMRRIHPQGMLLYNRISKITDPAALDSPLLDLLNVKYVLTTRHIYNENFTQVYDGEMRIYHNDDYLPRAFVVWDAEKNGADITFPLPISRTFGFVGPITSSISLPRTVFTEYDLEITDYTPNQVWLDVTLDRAGWLILTDSYFQKSLRFHTWKAYYTTVGAQRAAPTTASTAPPQERELQICRANGNFRAVRLPAGHHTVRFKFTPLSVKLGLFVSFMSGAVLFLLVIYAIWRRVYREDESTSTTQRVMKNSVAPMVLQLLNKMIDTAFAALMLRVLNPEAVGKYYFAVTLFVWMDTFTTFGLNILVQREVSKSPAEADRYLTNTSILRLILLATVAPIIALYIGVRGLVNPLAPDAIWAIVLLMLGLIPATFANGITAIFNAFEKMEYPAALTVVSVVLKVMLGTLVLLLTDWGIVGLAGASIGVNVITLAILFWLLRQFCYRPRVAVDTGMWRGMLATSAPLMINNVLSILFLKIDVALLEPTGAAVVGLYSVAYRFFDAINIIPASFTIAVFPIMSRYAAEHVGARTNKTSEVSETSEVSSAPLQTAYVLFVRILVLIALPIAAATIILAEPLVFLLGGSQYLPDSRVALQLMILSIPFGFINSVTHYVLISLNRQRYLTVAFIVGFGFTALANLIFIPLYSYRAAALIHLLSEIVLLAAFYYDLRKHLGAVNWVRTLWRPLAAAALMGGAAWVLRGMNPLLNLGASFAAYAVGIFALRVLKPEEIQIISRALPLGKQ